MGNKNTKIYQLADLLKSNKFTSREAVNKLVWTTSSSSLIISLQKKWHQITTIRDFDEIHWYEYEGYLAPLHLIALDIKRNHPRLEKLVRFLYYINK